MRPDLDTIDARKNARTAREAWALAADVPALLDYIQRLEAERSNFQQIGWWNERRGFHPLQLKRGEGIHEYECYVTDEPVFRLGVLSLPPQKETA